MAHVPTVPYADEAFGTAYFGERLYTDAWDNATSPDRDAALKQATRLIDQLPFVDEKTDEAQVREFPRQGDTEIPYEVQEACCEVALAILDGFDPLAASKSTGVKSETVGDASITYGGDRGEMGRTDDYFGLPSPEAAALLAPWIQDPAELDITRV